MLLSPSWTQGTFTKVPSSHWIGFISDCWSSHSSERFGVESTKSALLGVEFDVSELVVEFLDVLVARVLVLVTGFEFFLIHREEEVVWSVFESEDVAKKGLVKLKQFRGGGYFYRPRSLSGM